MLKISFEKANAKESGREYEYVSVRYNDVEVTRLFIKNTEKQFYTQIIGNYEKKLEK